MTGVQTCALPIFGARKIDRVKKTFKLLITICLSYSLIVGGLLLLFPEFFVTIFNNKPELVAITSWSIRIYFVGMTLFGAQIACQQTFLSLGQAKISLFIAMLRKIILLVPLIFIMPMFMDNKLQAVLMAEPVADILSVLATISIFAINYKRLFPQVDQGDRKSVV